MIQLIGNSKLNRMWCKVVIIYFFEKGRVPRLPVKATVYWAFFTPNCNINLIHGWLLRSADTWVDVAKYLARFDKVAKHGQKKKYWPIRRLLFFINRCYDLYSWFWTPSIMDKFQKSEIQTLSSNRFLIFEFITVNSNCNIFWYTMKKNHVSCISWNFRLEKTVSFILWCN